MAAARRGLRTVLVTEDRHVGGMQTSGLGWTNAGQPATVGGVAREFFERLRPDYVRHFGPDALQVRDFSAGWRFESHVAERVYEAWLRESGVGILRGDPVIGVEKSGTSLRAVVTAAGRRLAARHFVDASYEGDLLALAGCSWHLGRESASTYGESLAGVRFPAHRAGRGDRAPQGFDYRLCLTSEASNRIAVGRPARYDAARYRGVLRRLAARQPLERAQQIVPLNPLPNGKTDSRTGEWTGALGHGRRRAWRSGAASPPRTVRMRTATCGS